MLNGAETKELMSACWGGAYTGTVNVTSVADNVEPIGTTYQHAEVLLKIFRIQSDTWRKL